MRRSIVVLALAAIVVAGLATGAANSAGRTASTAAKEKAPTWFT